MRLSEWKPSGADRWRHYPDGRWAAMAGPTHYVIREIRGGNGAILHPVGSLADAMTMADVALRGLGHELGELPTPVGGVLDEVSREIARQTGGRSLGHFESDLRRTRAGLLRIADDLGVGTASGQLSERERMVMVLALAVAALAGEGRT